jgi:hypothetical protein
MQRQDLSAASFVTTRLTALLLALAGVLFLFRPSWLGWDALVRSLGGETAVLGAGIGVGFLLLASLSYEKNQLRVRVAEQTEALHQLLYGKDYSQHREAIEILVRALEGTDAGARKAAHEHLVRLTGQNFAADAGVWRAWWEASRRTWAVRRPDGAGPGA